jgi:rhodanese-related sulfurtransferase
MKTLTTVYLGILLAGALAVQEAEACACCGCAAKKAAAAGTALEKAAKPATVDTAGLKALLESDKEFVLLDARSGKWDDGRRIAHAKLLPAGSSKRDIAKALPDKNAQIVTYCSNTKCPASGKLAHALAKLGYKNVTEYPQGIEGWVEAGNGVKQ